METASATGRVLGRRETSGLRGAAEGSAENAAVGALLQAYPRSMGRRDDYREARNEDDYVGRRAESPNLWPSG